MYFHNPAHGGLIPSVHEIPPFERGNHDGAADTVDMGQICLILYIREILEGLFRAMDLVSSFTSDAVGKAMTGLSKRFIAISSNLANVDTPGYHHKEVVFEDSLKQAIQAHQEASSGASGAHIIADNDSDLPMLTSQPGHFSNVAQVNSLDDVEPQVKEDEHSSYRNDGNSVDIESEMAQLSKNTEHYIALANLGNRLTRNVRNVLTNIT